MKYKIYLVVYIICSLSVFSCTKDIEIDNSDLTIKINNEYTLSQDDIEFYDSSTCILYLKEKIEFQYRFIDIDSTGHYDFRFEDFAVYIDDEIIYSGKFHPANVAGVSSKPIYIPCYSSSDSVSIDVMHIEFYEKRDEVSLDNRNDHRIIDYFKNHNLLKNGIEFSIENIAVSPSNDSVLVIQYTIKNNDRTEYLIPDPKKMNARQIAGINSGSVIFDDTGNNINIKLSNDYSVERKITIDCLSKIKKYSKTKFTMSLPYWSNFKKGKFESKIFFKNMMYLNFEDLDLNQEEGRIWIGSLREFNEFEVK